MEKQGIVGIPLQEFKVIYDILMYVRLGDRNVAEADISKLMIWVGDQPELLEYLESTVPTKVVAEASDEDGLVLNLV